MGSSDLRDLPSYWLSDFNLKGKHFVLSPAMRWQVVVDEVIPVERDVLLETVLRFLHAGEKNSKRIAELLALPTELIQHLFAQITQQNLKPASASDLLLDFEKEMDIESSQSTVAWAYRDLVSGELWPDRTSDLTPLTVRFSNFDFANIEFGTAGNPQKAKALLLNPQIADPVPPKLDELGDSVLLDEKSIRRALVVGSGERCLVLRSLFRNETGPFVEFAPGLPHISLSAFLEKVCLENDNFSNWIQKIDIEESPRAAENQLHWAISKVQSKLEELKTKKSFPVANELFSDIESCLKRICNYEWSMLQVELPVALKSASTCIQEIARILGTDSKSLRPLEDAEAGGIIENVANLMVRNVELGQVIPNENLMSLLKMSVNYGRLSNRTVDYDSCVTLGETVIMFGQKLIQSEGHNG